MDLWCSWSQIVTGSCFKTMFPTTKDNVNNNNKNKSRFHSRISFGSSTINRIKFIEGVRTFMALVVIFHHVDLLNPRINRVSNLIWKIDANRTRIKHFHHVEDNNDNIRQLLSNKGHPSGGKLTTFGMFASVFDITLFCLITGYVISLVAWKCYNYDFEFDNNNNNNNNNNTEKNLILATSNYPFWIYKFVRLIIRRSLKMLHSLFWVQFGTFLGFHFELLTLRGGEIWRAREYYKYPDFWVNNCHFGAFFWSEINGALWVCDILFWSTFASFIVLSITINITEIKYRIYIYLIFCLLFRDGYYLSILMGVIIADIDYNGYYQILFTKHKFMHNLLASSCLLLFFEIPIINIWPGKYLICKCILWANLGIYCLQYPKFWLTRFFAFDYLAYFGQYTLSLYIWHMIIYRFIGKNITPFFVDTKENNLTSLLFMDWIIVFSGAFISCIFAVLFNKLVETPFNTYVVKPLLQKFASLMNENDNHKNA